MNKLFLIRNPLVFQGERYLTEKKNYFEGWYFKNTCEDGSISFIPGININEEERNAFIQIITDDSSYYINYDIMDFSYSYDPFYVKIGDNTFSKEGIHIDIKNRSIEVYGDIKYSESIELKTSFISPNIMGPFSYVPFMECNHAIIDMKSRAFGVLSINERKMIFEDGIGYIEKDWGTSFPKSYIWCQGNNFQDKSVSFMISIADIPFKIFNFQGFICVLRVGDKEYRFTTYNGAKLMKYEVNEGFLNIVIKKGKYVLYIESLCEEGIMLIAPVKGKMEKGILESITSNVKVTLKNDDEIVFSGLSSNCGLEIVKD